MASCAHVPPPKCQDSDLRRPMAACFPGAYDLRALSRSHVRVWGAAGRGCRTLAWPGSARFATPPMHWKMCFIRDTDLHRPIAAFLSSHVVRALSLDTCVHLGSRWGLPHATAVRLWSTTFACRMSDLDTTALHMPHSRNGNEPGSADVLVSCTARRTSSSSRFRYDALRNRHGDDRRPCASGSYARRGLGLPPLCA
jgi:hypothetical protein